MMNSKEGAICYRTPEETHTYAELYAASDALSVWIDENLPADGPVIVYGGLEFRMIVCFLACVKAGRPYIPIDRHTPPERVRAIAEVARHTAVLEGGAARLPGEFGRVLAAGEIDGICARRDGASLPASKAVSGSDTFYIIFTSGTTGGLKKAPKGVMVSYDNLMSFTNWILRDFGIPSGSVWLAQAPFSFDLSVMNLWPALMSGGTLAPLEREVTDDFTALFRVLPGLGLRVWVSTPSFADICLMDPSFSGETQPDLSHFLFCGEELLHSTAAKLTERFPDAAVHNLYGPTEATVAVTDVPITAGILASHDRLPVGAAKPGTDIVIIDDEIIICGDSVAKGYLNNAEATEAAFFTYQGKPAYRTGDAGVIEDGMLYFKGRLDFQIKLHGYRIELEDVEHYLCRLPSVNAAAVVPKYDGYKVKSLTAFVVPADPESADRKALKQELRETVMEYMVPHSIIFVERLPLSQNGKVNRRALIDEVNA